MNTAIVIIGLAMLIFVIVFNLKQAKKNKFFYVRFLSSLFLSIAVLLSFRYTLLYSKNLSILIIFLIFQLIIWSAFFLSNKKIKVIFINFFFIIFLNLILTPQFYKVTFDIPVRKANNKQIIEYKRNFFKGIFSGIHTINTDEKGYRTNKKINYKKKPNNTIRVVTIGASSTEEYNTDDKKTWSNLLIEDLSKYTEKNIDLINMGMSGLRSKHHYVSLLRTKKYQPDIIIFLLGFNDWNNHILNSDKSYLIPFYEIKYDFEKSSLHKIYKKAHRQISKLFIKEKITDDINKVSTNQTIEETIESFLLSRSNSLEKRKIKKKFEPQNVSDEYDFWISHTAKECKRNQFICFFIDQPTGYKENVSAELKKRFWMTPAYEDYTLSLDNLIQISSLYNNWLRDYTTNNNLNFCSLSEKLEANTDNFFDDVHFSENGSKKVAEILSECVKFNIDLSVI